jgi:hypothetical protein
MRVTAPEKYLGFKPGTDFKLASFTQAAGYFDLLASETGRMRVMDMGPTPMGRRIKYAVISSEENIRRLNRYKEIAARLSLARGVDAGEAERMAVEGKAIVWIDGGLHATECAPAQHLIQLAYDLVAGEDEGTRNLHIAVQRPAPLEALSQSLRVLRYATLCCVSSQFCSTK